MAGLKQACPECGRVFDLLDEADAAELAFGHDCDAGEPAPCREGHFGCATVHTGAAALPRRQRWPWPTRSPAKRR